MSLPLRLLCEGERNLHQGNRTYHSTRSGKHYPKLEDLIGKTRIDMPQALSRNMLREAEEVVEDVEQFEGMFPSSDVVEDNTETMELMQDVLPIVDVDDSILEEGSAPGADPGPSRQVRASWFCLLLSCSLNNFHRLLFHKFTTVKRIARTGSIHHPILHLRLAILCPKDQKCLFVLSAPLLPSGWHVCFLCPLT